MRGPPAGPRVLLRRLREIMAEPISAQDRLDKIVTQIAANMVAEVCSVYVLRSDGVLELYATEGLKREAVHHASLRIGQGLVGTIAAEARPLNLPDAQSHPAFRYLPETGEEIYNSFLGVPILRAGRTLGVLVVQNRAHRTYYEEEVEALQTTAMVLAEMIAVGELERLGAARHAARPQARRSPSPASASCEGVGLGHVVLHEPRVVVTTLIGEDVEAEIDRLDEAIAGLRLFVDDMLSRDDIAETGEHRDVLEAYRMFAYDRGWVRRMHEAIRNGLTAEAAVEKVQSDMRARLQRQTDPFLRDRLHDFDDLANRLLRVLIEQAARAVRRRNCRATRSSSPATWARPNCSTTTASASAAWCWRRAAPTSHVDHRRPRARHRHGRPGRQRRRRWSRTATRSSSTARPARCISGRPPTSRRPMPRRCASAPGGRSSTGCCATSRR